jgi:ParB family chromosome partitioning protein
VDDPKAQEMLCDLVVRRGLSVRQLEEKVKALEKGEPQEKEPQDLPDMYYRLLENVGRYFGDNISLRRSPSGKGTITIKFDSDEQMEHFLQALDSNRG